MLKLLLLGGLIGFLTAFIGTFLALRIQHRRWSNSHIEREAWESAQEGHQYAWEFHQGKRLLEIEQRLSGQVQQVQEEWEQWEERNNDHTRQLSIEYTLMLLPKIEETPLALNGQHHFHEAPPDWEPPSFYKVSLQGRDFSHRYMGQANLREAKLAGANFYMADLRGACLVGANLAEANLIGANLAGADLREANLAGANLLVADLYQAILNGANLLGACNLTTQQMYTAIYDYTTQLDPAIDITMKRLPIPPVKTTGPALAPELMGGAFQSPFLLPQVSDDSQHAPGGPGLARDRQENRQLDTTIPRIMQNGTQSAMAG